MPVRLEGTTLERDRPIPQFRLTDPRTGRELSPWSVKGRRGLALAFLHGACDECAAIAEELAAVSGQLSAADTDLFAIAPEPVAPLPTLIDEGGEVARAYLGADGHLPTVVLADRYGSAWAAYRGFGHELPTTGELVATAWHMELSCADCSVPAWPADEAIQ